MQSVSPRNTSARLLGVLFAFLTPVAWAAIEPYQEYQKHVESAQKLTALKDDLFGDSVSLYNGKTEFGVTDVSRPGNDALPVQMRRRFSVEMDLIGDTSYNANINGVGGWEIDVPHISGTHPSDGWGDDRCSGTLYA